LSMLRRDDLVEDLEVEQLLAKCLQACIASLPIQSSLMSKTYLKSDHLNGADQRCT